MKAHGTLALTIDVDWAPEAVIADTLELLARYDAPATIFATHESPLLREAESNLVELGVHPNFNPLLEGHSSRTVDEVLAEIRGLYPNARGIRSHSMLQSTPLLQRFVAHGFTYEANCFLPYDDRLRPRRLWMDLTRVPYNWEDDVHWGYGRSFADFNLTTGPTSLNVLGFHPIHIYLNTESAARYEAARPHYQDPSSLETYRNVGPTPGTRDLFIKALKWCQTGLVECVRMDCLAERVGVEAP